ncbi:DUF1289 domain-containing protein [Serratia marcescens]|uniref:DUF1289 domain-containing protein n=1 Tax=Serratia TaxID=613 RepID=UPI0015719D3D|nr:DUF1289 domain-containing protein [Serratia marcescens]MBI6135933.1 DUF1289 domain-containing protein [Serratia marcescens]MBN5321951.1 DUF1289 domain-containing protein [Serratia marcescens]MCA4111905.1 DUF1289 domain-containing protein [Serratia marcescens]MDN0030301.1 DUF1289 domain-containing protein [Serratia marcescens]NSM18983.1 DUF1289 domain-containing protein [Serratia marcescens]
MAVDNQQFQHGVRSPCVSLCRIDDETQRCRGCWRTRAEIAAWPTASDAEKRAIWRRLELRAAFKQNT